MKIWSRPSVHPNPNREWNGEEIYFPGDAHIVRLEDLSAVGGGGDAGGGAAPEGADGVVEAAVEEERGGGDAAEEAGGQQPVEELGQELSDLVLKLFY